jgi:TonB family protein
MMSAYANSVQKPERFDMYVRKFRSICAMHDVQIGSSVEFPGFIRKLMDDRHLAMDFWAFVGKLSSREGGELSDDQLLGVIVEGITDSEYSPEDRGQERSMDDLRAMLAGVDIQAPEQSKVEIAPFPRSETGSQRDVSQLWTRATESTDEPPNLQAPAARDVMSEKTNKDERRTAGLPPSPQLDETLLRLELTRLVQQYFDNIDKRISKLEPPVDGATVATAVTRRSLEDPVSEEEMEELRLRRMGRARLVLESPPQHVDDSPPENDSDVPIHIPLEHYSPPTVFGKAPLLLIVVLVISAFALYRDPTLVQKGYSALVRQIHNNGPITSAILRLTRPKPAGQEPPATQPEQTQPSALQSVVNGASAPSPESTPEPDNSSPAARPAAPSGGSSPVRSASEDNSTPSNPKTAEHSSSVRSLAGGDRTDSSNNGRRRAMADRVPVTTEQVTANDISNADATRLIQVDPFTMERNLLVSRVPAYPETAKLNRVAGQVTMQAIISKDGTVTHVHVTEGDSRLRAAAEEAVYKWRYRPYVLNGQPVEVATTVTVNFNLNR